MLKPIVNIYKKEKFFFLYKNNDFVRFSKSDGKFIDNNGNVISDSEITYNAIIGNISKILL